MRYLLLLCLLATPCCGGEIATITLDPDASVSVQISNEETTTLLFPEAVSAIVGNALTNGMDGNSDGEVQYSHEKGSKLLALMARSETAKAAAVIVLGERLFLFRFGYSREPQLAVTLKFRRERKATSQVKGPVLPPPLDYSQPNLLRLITLANSYRLPTSRIPARRTHLVRKRGNLESTIKAVTLFQKEGAIVISGDIRNLSPWRKARPHSKTFRVRLGGRIMEAALIQVPRAIGRRSTSSFALIVMSERIRRGECSLETPVELLISP